MTEMARVTKTGGIVCIATEVLLRDDQTHPEFFTRREFTRYILEASAELSLIGRMHWNANLDDYIGDPVLIPQDSNRWRRHVVLQAGDLQWTSAIAFLRKGGRKWSDSLRWLPPRRSKSNTPSAADENKSPYSIGHHLVHNSARCEAIGGKTLRVLTPAQPWSFAVEFPLRSRPEGSALNVAISASVRENPVRFGILKPNGGEYIQEVEIAANAKDRSAEFSVPADVPAGSLTVRTAALGSSAVEFEITQCELTSPQLEADARADSRSVNRGVIL
jgi:hypothetical protein